ncbi:MAG: ABC transporter ATP-binding protein [Oenococcus sp.]|uniref:ABC transporter ATP-binding protein n=1 Tax=Oenococcus sp. TaxID=1979414 RepID=UPI0039EB8567
MSKYLKEQWGGTLFCVFLIALMSGSKVAAALINTYLLNSLISFQRNRFLMLAGLAILTWVIFAFLIYIVYSLRARLVQKMSLSLRHDISQQISGLPYGRFHAKNSDDYSSWLMNDVTMIENGGFSVFFDIISVSLDAIFSIIALLSFHWSLVVLTLLLSVVTIFAPQLMQKKLKKASVETSQANENFAASVNDMLHGFDTLFAYNLTQRIINHVDKSGRLLQAKKVQLGRTQAAATSIGVLANAGSQLITIAWTGALALARLTPIGSILSTGALASNVFNGLANLGPTLTSVKSLNPLFAKYHLGVDTSLNTSNQSTKSLADATINLTNLSYRYQDKIALKPVSIKLPLNSKVIITGESGAGKSTLLNILAGKLLNYSGSVKIAGQELKNLSSEQLRKTITYVDQIPYIFNGTIRDNLTLGEKFSDDAIFQALKRSDLFDFVMAQKQGLDSSVGEKGQLFSGGQRQRLALARGLLRNPQILLVDEGTNSLKSESAIQVEKQFLSLQDMTVIFVTHQLHEEIRPEIDQLITLA